MNQCHCQIGPFSLDTPTMRVLCDGTSLKLRPQAFLALKTLVCSAGHYVDYDQLIKEAWDGNIVSRHTVATTIAAARRALGEYGSWISYRPSLGYRLQVPGSDDLIRAGWHLYNRRTRQGFERALNTFQQAVDEDGPNSHGFEGIAHCYMMLGVKGMRPPHEMYRGFLEAHARAIAVSGWTPELRSLRGQGLHMFERRFHEAEKEFLQSQQEKPDLAVNYVRLALLYSTLGRLDDAVKIVVQARKIDPLCPPLYSTEVFIHLCRGDYGAAISSGKEGLERHPYLHVGRVYYAQALEYAGRVEEALVEYRLARVIAPDVTWIRALEARCLARSGQIEKAEDLFEELVKVRLTEYVDAYYIALLLDALGRRDDAIGELERAVEENSAALCMLNIDPKMESLRTDRRFKPLRNKLFGVQAPV